MSASAAELAARASYGRLLALVAARTGDLASAEDALSDAFLAALEQWPRDGVPRAPEAWLLTAARRRLVDQKRREAVRSREAEAVALAIEQLGSEAGEGEQEGGFADDRLKLLFVCTHPAIAPEAQIPLMLQTVLGLDAATIASALRVAPKTMGQRLWRAKAKIAESRVPFEVPDRRELPERIGAVLEAVYAAYGAAWDDARGDDARLKGLASEAIFLARLICELLADEPEALGLLSLLLFAEARRSARRGPDGAFVPLEEQDRSRWSMPLLAEAERLLGRASSMGRLGAFQLEAAIQSAHVAGLLTGRPDREAVASLYDGLVSLSPSLGARVGRAAALLGARGPRASLEALDALDGPLARAYQPYWAVRAEALRAAGRAREAREAAERAMGMTEDDACRRYLEARFTRP